MDILVKMMENWVKKKNMSSRGENFDYKPKLNDCEAARKHGKSVECVT